MKAMRSFHTKNRIKAFILAAALSMSSLSGCGRMKYAEPDLVEPIAVTKMYKKPEIGDIKAVKGVAGVVVPTDYPVYCKGLVMIDSLKVKIGDYVEAGDVIATGIDVSNGNSVEDYDRMISEAAEERNIQTKIDEATISIAQYDRAEAAENGNTEGVSEADKNIALLSEDKRYNEEMSSRDIRSNSEKREKLKAEKDETVIVAPHSGYVTFLKDIADSNMPMPYENIAVISDMDDLYIECREITITQNWYKNYDEKYIYVNGEKKDIKEIEYSPEAVSLAQVQHKDVFMRYSADADLKAGENVVLIFKDILAENVMTVGTAAVVHDGINNYVYVRKNDSDELQMLLTGIDHYGDYKQILIRNCMYLFVPHTKEDENLDLNEVLKCVIALGERQFALEVMPSALATSPADSPAWTRATARSLYVAGYFRFLWPAVTASSP